MDSLTWAEVLKENLAGRTVETHEMGVYFRAEIDRIEQDGVSVSIHPKGWTRLYGTEWRPWQTEETSSPKPLRFKTDGTCGEPYIEDGNTAFDVPFKGHVRILAPPRMITLPFKELQGVMFQAQLGISMALKNNSSGALVQLNNILSIVKKYVEEEPRFRDRA